jgi:uncharacterized protein (TIGR02444 family)
MTIVSWSRHPPVRESGAFWRFSLGFYGRPGVAGACLDLQDRVGRDVNLVLYACWIGASGRGRLGLADLARAEAEVAPWRQEVVEKLRAIRRLAKEEPEAADFLAAVRAAELKAEARAQSRLEALAPAAPPDEIPAERRLADALANLALYLGGADATPIRHALAVEIG